MPPTTNAAKLLSNRLGTPLVSEKIKVTFTGVTETLLIPLLNRAIDAKTPRPILGDLYAGAVVEKLDYDFTKFPTRPTPVAAVALRTRHYDRWTAAFLAAHSRATVLHLACGLDSRNQRVDWGPGVRWIDVDLPEVVALRSRVLPTTLSGQDYRLVAADVTQNDWLEEIPTDRPALVVMEGLVSYLPPDAATGLLKRLADRLTEGELHFECLNSKVVVAARKDKKAAVSQTGAVFQWAVDDLKDVENIHNNLRLLESIPYIQAPGVEEFLLLSRIGYYLLSWMPSVRDGVRFVRFGFSAKANEG